MFALSMYMSFNVDPIEKLVAKPMEMTYQQTKTIIHRKLGST